MEVAEGNPLFLEELAASIAELGDGGVLPVTVREAIASRIDAMPAKTRAILLSAAVIGKTFWRGVLSAVAGPGHVDEALSVLEARDLVRREATSQLAGDVEFTFKHMLIREVAYSTVPRALRRERHAAVARYVEETIEGSSATLAWVLAYHWREAGEDSRAIPYLLAAAEAAFRGWAQDAVADLYSTALELAEDETLRRGIRLQRGLALVRLEEYEMAAEELGELLPELEGAERLEALLARGRATLWTERDAETVEIADEAVSLAAELGDEEGIPRRSRSRAKRTRCEEPSATSIERSSSETERSSAGCPERETTTTPSTSIFTPTRRTGSAATSAVPSFRARPARSQQTSTAPRPSCAAAAPRPSRWPRSGVTRRRSGSGTSCS